LKIKDKVEKPDKSSDSIRDPKDLTVR